MTRPLPFVLAASDHGPMIVNRLDFHCLPSGATYGVGHQILSRGSYDPDEIRLVQGLLSGCFQANGKGVVALDCGANIGVHTVEMARHMTGWGSVVGIEAQERIFYALCGNIALLNLFNAQAIFGAVGSMNGRLAVPQPNYMRPASFGSLELQQTLKTEYIGQSISYAEKDLVEVPLLRIDSLGLKRLDFLKIDIEGMEIEALRGAAEVLSQFKPIILLEWIKSDRQALEDFLIERGYEVKEKGANLLALPTSSMVHP